MDCRKCGKIIPDGSVYCMVCGAKQVITTKHTKKRGNGEGSAYKRGKYWQADLVIGYEVNEQGRLTVNRLTRSGFTTKKAALEFLDVLKAAKAAGIPRSDCRRLFDECQKLDSVIDMVNHTQAFAKRSPAADLTLKELYDRWKPYYEDRIDETTMGCYRAAMNYYRPIYNVRFADLYVDDFQECVTECPRGKRTKENMRTIASLLCKYAVILRIVPPQHEALASYLYLGNDSKGTRPALTLDHLEMLRFRLATSMAAQYTYCLCYTGFRPNEMLSLKKDAYHEDKDGCYLIGGFKTEAGTDRTVPLSPKILPIVKSLMAKPGEYIFPKSDGTMMTDDYFRERLFYPLMAELGIQPLPSPENPAKYVPYSCRHTFANLMKNVAGSETDKAALMGHADAHMTKYYQSEDMASLRSIINCI